MLLAMVARFLQKPINRGLQHAAKPRRYHCNELNGKSAKGSSFSNDCSIDSQKECRAYIFTEVRLSGCGRAN